LRSLIAAVERIDPLTVSGSVAAVNGLLIEARGSLTRLGVGARAEIVRRGGEPLAAEVVGFREGRALLMPFGPLEGVAPGAEIRIAPEGAVVRPTLAWLGRIIDAFGRPIDGGPPLPQGEVACTSSRGPRPPTPAAGSASRSTSACAPSTPSPPAAAASAWASSPAPASASRCCCRCWPGAPADVNVIGLVGERGREVQEFIAGRPWAKKASPRRRGGRDLRRAGPDAPQAAYMTLAMAEFFATRARKSCA
jgi:flagellum-specific ATP synthase